MKGKISQAILDRIEKELASNSDISCVGDLLSTLRVLRRLKSKDDRKAELNKPDKDGWYKGYHSVRPTECVDVETSRDGKIQLEYYYDGLWWCGSQVHVYPDKWRYLRNEK